MIISVIIPTLYRDSLIKTIQSINHKNVIPIIESGETAGENRNRGIQKAKKINSDWIVFLDDDDYMADGWIEHLDSQYEIIVLRMKQNNAIIPDATNKLVYENIGINIALNMKKIDWNDLPEFDCENEAEDWRFIKKLLEKYQNYKVTDNIYYIAPQRNFSTHFIKNNYTDWMETVSKIPNKKDMSIVELGYGDGTKFLAHRFKSVVSIEFSRYDFLPKDKFYNHTYLKIEPDSDTLQKDDILISSLGKTRPVFSNEISKLMIEIQKYKSDIIFVDFGFHFRGEVVQRLIDNNNHDYIIYHDTNFPYYNYENICFNNYQIKYQDKNNQGTIVLKKENNREPIDYVWIS